MGLGAWNSHLSVKPLLPTMCLQLCPNCTWHWARGLGEMSKRALGMASPMLGVDPLVWLLSPALLTLCLLRLSKHNKLIASLGGGSLIESNSSLSPGPYEKSIYIVQSHAPLPCLHTYIQGENPCNRLFLGTLPRWSPVSILPHVKLGPSLCHPPGKESCEGL